MSPHQPSPGAQVDIRRHFTPEVRPDEFGGLGSAAVINQLQSKKGSSFVRETL
jgi:hypothetical protein